MINQKDIKVGNYVACHVKTQSTLYLHSSDVVIFNVMPNFYTAIWYVIPKMYSSTNETVVFNYNLILRSEELEKYMHAPFKVYDDVADVIVDYPEILNARA